MSYNPRDGQIQVHTGRDIVRGQIADDLTIPVEINDASFIAAAAMGDKVAAEVLPLGRTRGQALILKIEAAKTLGGGDPKMPVKQPEDRIKPRRETKSPKAGPDKSAPAPDQGLPSPEKERPAAAQGLPAPAEDK